MVDDEVGRAVALHAEANDLCEAGKHRRAAVTIRRALRLLERHSDPHHPDVANALLVLGRAQEQGDAWHDARRSYERAATILLRYARVRDPDVRRLQVKVARALCGVMRMLGHTDRAAHQARRAVNLAQRWFGPRDLDLAAALNELGVVRKCQGRYAEAPPLYRRALSILRAAGLEDTSEAASVYHNLGGIAHAQGHYERAEAPARRAVALRRLSPQPPALAADLAALAAVLEGRGKLVEAASQYRSALEIFRRVLGPRSYEVGVNLAGLAGTYQARGRFAHAVRLYRRAHAIHHRLLGHRHVDVAVTLHNLTVALASRGQVSEARRTGQSALKAFRSSAGPRHPHTVGCRTMLARLEILSTTHRSKTKESKSKMKTGQSKKNTTRVRTQAGVKIRTGVKAGGLSSINHNRPLIRKATAGVKVRTGVKAGGLSSINHSRTIRT